MPSPLGRSPGEVRRCPVRFRAPRLRSGAARCNLEPAVEVRRCPLQSGARYSGPALPTALWRSMLTSGEEDGEDVCQGRKKKEGRRRTSYIKSNNPHLTGGEKHEKTSIRPTDWSWVDQRTFNFVTCLLEPLQPHGVFTGSVRSFASLKHGDKRWWIQQNRDVVELWYIMESMAHIVSYSTYIHILSEDLQEIRHDTLKVQIKYRRSSLSQPRSWRFARSRSQTSCTVALNFMLDTICNVRFASTCSMA